MAEQLKATSADHTVPSGSTAEAVSDEVAVQHERIAQMDHVAALGPLPQKRLIPLLVKLKGTLWMRDLRSSVLKIIGTLLGFLYILFLVVMVGIGVTVTALVDRDGALYITLVQSGGAMLTLTWLLGALFAFGVDSTLEPSRFALLGRRARELQPGMLAASFLGVGPILTVLLVLYVSVITAIWLLTGGGSAIATVIALIALVPSFAGGVVMCLLLPRAISAQVANVAVSRRLRELGGIAAILALLAVAYGASIVLQSLDGAGMEGVLAVLQTILQVLMWTPLGALFAAPLDLAAGAYLVGAARLLIGAAALVLLWLWWERALDGALTSALVGQASSGKTKARALVPRWAPRTAFGASLGKSLRYWTRDSRYLAAVGVYPLVLVFFAAMALLGGLPAGSAVGLCMLLALLAGVSLCNEIGFDGPSGWVNITAGVPGRSLLAGKAVALLVVIGPMMLIATGAIIWLLGLSELLIPLVIGALGLLLAGTGVSLVISVLLPYRASPPGVNPMKDKSTSQGAAWITMGAASAAVILVQAPALVLGMIGVTRGSSGLLLTAALLALLVGVAAMWFGSVSAGRLLDRRYPVVFQKVRSYL